MTKYKVLGTEVDSFAVVDIPDDLAIVGVLHNLVIGALTLVCIQEYEEWRRQNKKDANEEDAARIAAGEEPLVRPIPATPTMTTKSPKVEPEVGEGEKVG